MNLNYFKRSGGSSPLLLRGSAIDSLAHVTCNSRGKLKDSGIHEEDSDGNLDEQHVQKKYLTKVPTVVIMESLPPFYSSQQIFIYLFTISFMLVYIYKYS